ncbi:MAG: HAD hydrolase-like protein [Lachnospiraceae bacterium]|nr:HAD hydrolase-like protein [Lachnospiraceae bacterium]
MKYRLVLWDLDGTLIKTEEGIYSCVRHAFARLGLSGPEPQVLRRFIGPSLYDSFTKRCGLPPEQADAAVEFYRERYNVTGLFEAEVYPGIPEALEALAKAGVMQMVVTSKPQVTARRVVEHFGIMRYMRDLIGPGFSDRGSHKEGMILAAVDRANELAAEAGEPPISLSQVLMVGDTRFDAEGAAAAGVDCAGNLYGYGTREELIAAGAKHLVETPAEIVEIVEIVTGEAEA